MNSNADIIRDAIDTAEADKIDLSQKKNRQEVIGTITKNNKHLVGKENSLQASFSKEISKKAKARGEQPKDYKDTPKPKYDSKLKSSKSPNPIKVKTPSANQPVGENSDQPSNKPEPEMINKLAQEIFGGSMEVCRLLNENIPSFSDKEKTTLADIWTPYLVTKINSENEVLVIGVIATLAMFGKHIKEGRDISKEKKKHEIKKIENKEQKIKQNKTDNEENIINHPYPKNGEPTEYD